MEPHACRSDEGVPALICLHDVHKRFGEKTVLAGLTLAVFPGETVVILGPSGSGKSVTLRHIIGLERPDAGQVFVGGEQIEHLPERKLRPVREKIGFLFQGGALFDSLDVFGNIAFPLREALWLPERIERRVFEVLELVDLEPRVAQLMPSSLSGGMRKRVALARAIAVKPEAILYDEPTTGLDPVTANTINDLIRSMQARLGVTSVVVTHDIESAFHVGDRITFLHEGRLHFTGTVEQARATDDPILAGFLAGRSQG
ncbi:MAG: ATP-binding cassette domain-containing protein [Acidobacteria bacterium]|nr:ATP-binding cassette domain-containing protein [Acidobacteriota bacterium]